MFKHFIKLQWKSFFRSSSFGKGLALKILMAFFGIYMLGSLAFLGVFLYAILKKAVPGMDPMITLNKFMIYWFIIELFFRYFMQKLPVLDVKPLLTLPIRKSAITHYILVKSGLSFYNFLSLFLLVPFVVVTLGKGYPIFNSLIWLFGMVCIVITINYLNFIVNKSDKFLVIIIAIIALLYGLQYFDVFSITGVAGRLFYSLYENPVYVLVPLLLSITSYYINYSFLRNRIFLDTSFKKKTKEAISSDLSWTKRFGEIAPFLQLDLKLIWRNKRTKVQTFISFAMVFYGLIFHSMGDYVITSPIFVFVGIFITGIFLMNFGQFIPAWDSEYYSMMMSQNIPLRKYLESKAGLISVSIVVMFLLSIPYVYFGWQAVAINLSCALYNLGINIPVILFFGSMNKKRIDLTKSALGNMQGTGAAQFLVGIPLFGAPMLIYLGLYYLISLEVALIVLGSLGIIGFAFRKPILDRITEMYRVKKYTMVAGFKEENS
ncbi:MAG: DUF5687 family protein [Bacteroidota bacterium]